MLGRIVACLFLVSIICFAGGKASAAQARPVDELRKSVLALDSAWTRALKDLQQKKQGGTLQSSDTKDYAKFINYLSGRINEYCRQLRLEGGPQAVTDLPCPDESALSAEEKLSFTPSTTQQVAELDQELTKALGDFDQQLLSEEERLASRQPAGREYGSVPAHGGGTGTGRGAGSGQNGSGGLSGQGGQPGTGGQSTGAASGGNSQGGSQGTGTDNSGGSYSGQGGQTSSGGAGAGAGKPGTQDQQPGRSQIEEGYDDIVARQLREAAEKETDPELKKKLWEEYRKYSGM